MISLLWQPHSRLMLQAARCFAAIQKALPSLRRFYEALDQEVLQRQAPKRQLEYPYPASFIGPQGSALQLHYKDKLSSFKATLDQEDGSVLVIVFFFFFFWQVILQGCTYLSSLW